MTTHKVSRWDLLAACDQPGEDDGVDPRHLRPHGPPRVANRKALQLCGQVARTLALVLDRESGDPVLRDLLVASVVPSPNSSRLLVTVHPAPGAGGLDPATVLGHLERARGWLRSEVATAVNRRKTPDLTFRFVPLDLAAGG
jgi:ribosome-binding factor A